MANIANGEAGLTVRSTLNNTGLRKNNFVAAVAPVVTDDSAAGYEVMSIWWDATGGKMYKCTDATAAAAVWLEVLTTDSGAEIKTAYELEADTNAYDDAAVSKLAGVETNATADQTGAEIKTAYELEANAFTDTKNTKLSGVEALADVTDAANVGAVANGQKHLFIPANAMTPRTTGGAASGTIETTTNKVMVDTYDFDSAADEHVQFSMQMPKSWDEGTLIAQFIWSHPTTTVNFGIVFFIQAVSFADSDALDAAFGTAVSATDTGGTTDDVFISPETAAITVAGTPGAEEWVTFQIYRDVSDGSDDMAVDARLHGVKIHYTTDALTDA